MNGCVQYCGFKDEFNFDHKPWGKGRSYWNEFVTRAYGSAVNGKSFFIYNNKRCF